MKRIVYIIGIAVFLWFHILLTLPAAAAGTLDLAAESAILMDFTTGEILYQKNATERKAPASTTKIVTALVALERGDLNQTIVVSPTASRTEGSSIWLASGEKHTLEDMLYGILLSSGNDAAVAVAENLAGTEKQFAEWMTEKARELGATSSTFKNSSGLPEEGHLTTAKDLALITRYALHNPVFNAIVKTKYKTIHWPDHDEGRHLINHNKLLWRYEYTDGVKTGYTREAGRCLVASATRNGHRLISVVLNSKRMYEDTKALFEYGFNNFQLLNLVSPQEKLAEIQVNSGVLSYVPVMANRSLTLLLPKGAEARLKVNLLIQSAMKAPVERMQQVGELQVRLDEELIDKIPVVAAFDVPKQSFWQRLLDWVKRLI